MTYIVKILLARLDFGLTSALDGFGLFLSAFSLLSD